MGFKFTSSRLAVICLLAVLVIGGGVKADAQTPLGITVSPAFQLVSIPQDASQQPVVFTITNDKPTPQKLSLSVADFNTLNESGGLFFVGTNPTALQKKYGLAKWVSLPETGLTIPAKQTVKIQADILNLSTLAAGGHYGALMIALDTAGGSGGANQVGLHPIASSLLFVTKLQGATYDLNLTNVYFHHDITKLPSGVTLRFFDFGNTHLVPRGVINLTGPGGTLISKGVVNQNSGIILPQTYRQYPVPLSQLLVPKTPGRYKLTVSYRFDGYSGFRTYQVSFIYVPLIDLIIFIAIVLVFIICIFWVYRKIRPKKKRKIKIEVK